VKELVPKDYLVVDTLSFDQKYDWTQIVAEGDEDAISGEGGIVVIPKTGVPSMSASLIFLSNGTRQRLGTTYIPTIIRPLRRI
jgi:hypothetical protein